MAVPPAKVAVRVKVGVELGICVSVDVRNGFSVLKALVAVDVDVEVGAVVALSSNSVGEGVALGDLTGVVVS